MHECIASLLGRRTARRSPKLRSARVQHAIQRITWRCAAAGCRVADATCIDATCNAHRCSISQPPMQHATRRTTHDVQKHNHAIDHPMQRSAATGRTGVVTVHETRSSHQGGDNAARPPRASAGVGPGLAHRIALHRPVTASLGTSAQRHWHGSGVRCARACCGTRCARRRRACRRRGGCSSPSQASCCLPQPCLALGGSN